MHVQNLDKMNEKIVFDLNPDLQTSCVSATQTILVSGNINCLNSLLLNASSFHSDQKSKIPSENCSVEKNICFEEYCLVLPWVRKLF